MSPSAVGAPTTGALVNVFVESDRVLGRVVNLDDGSRLSVVNSTPCCRQPDRCGRNWSCGAADTRLATRRIDVRPCLRSLSKHDLHSSSVTASQGEAL